LLFPNGSYPFSTTSMMPAGEAPRILGSSIHRSA
jgi:hypothetical protein